MVSTKEIREKYLKFFIDRDHKEIAPSPLVIESDPTTLFTSAGMQPLIPYLKGKPHPKGKRLVNVQPSLRLQDIDEVGDNRHTTFFEMLGNWSLGDYFKKEQLPWIWEFFTQELGLDKSRLWVSVFEGNDQVPKDTESFEIWKSLGVPEERIRFYGVEKNWWSRSGEPEKMPAGEIGGPDSEIFYDFGEELKVHENSPYKNEKCHPNCECGRFLEIGNSVFIQYQKNEDGSLSELPQKNVDFGGGLERITAAVNDNPDIFKIDLFEPIIEAIEKTPGKSYVGNERPMRIIADHLKTAAFITSEGILPGNKGHGYILRRVIRRAFDSAANIGFADSISSLAALVASIYEDIFPKLKEDVKSIRKIIEEEEERYKEGIKTASSYVKAYIRGAKKISGVEAFKLYSSHGLSPEQLRAQGYKFDEGEFEEEKKKHKELSRTASAGMFKGGLANHSEGVTKLHTATHLLHAALRKILGSNVSQKGSNITAERLRFDFSHPEKLTDQEVKKVEDLVNKKIKEDLPVSFKEMSLKEAMDSGALHFFGERYGERVKVYKIGDFSKEICGGPHVEHTAQIGRVKIIKQEKIGSGVIRIYATTE